MIKGLPGIPNYASETQRIVAESRGKRGYSIENCEYIGRLCIYLYNENTNHTMVLNSDGYDIYIPRDVMYYTIYAKNKE